MNGERGAGLLHRVLIEIADDHERAGTEQLGRYRPTDPVSTSGDQGYSTLQRAALSRIRMIQLGEAFHGDEACKA
jgi:hypothetical protein